MTTDKIRKVAKAYNCSVRLIKHVKAGKTQTQAILYTHDNQRVKTIPVSQ